MKLVNKVAFVTGAGQGMGRAMVRRFAAEGAMVVAADINLDAARETIEGLAGGNALALACNVADSASVAAAMAAVVERFGRLDVLVNNAGIGSVDAFLDTPDENWLRVIGVNLTGVFLCSREAARLMHQRGEGGVIVNLSSTAAISGEGPSHYCAAKAGVMGLTRSLARELAASQIRVNTIVPGPTNTPMMAGIPDDWMQSMVKAIPLGRMCEPDEIARVAAFLASDDASFITGQNIAVNGGMAFI
ncbi:SDR family NAD(P)-dependent oxidoreductase [Pseudomonas sp. GCM10022188]|uniref:SDR family NAD(P)-dependent oxidoreductase n=1 Tax=Pseudomonas TaxID=286 RepID=UPI001E4B84F2|nr:SDR family oxidoreductase [Pseudomonas oryzagri]MCC6075392.1 SDR family oxidoreductase [Pseudomonas oryzagri]